MRLTPREKRLVAVGALVVLLVGAAEWVVRPLWQRRQELRAQVNRGKDDMKALRDLVLRYRRHSPELRELERRLVRPGDGFSLFSFLEDAARKAGIRNRLVSMNPSKSTGRDGYGRIEMSLQFEDLTMAQVVGYLEQLERAPRLLRVRELSVERSSRPGGLLRVHALVVAYSAPGNRKEKS